MTEKQFDEFQENLEENQCCCEADDCCEDWENEIRLDKIDEVVKRTGLSFSEAKDILEKFDYDLVEALAAVDAACQQEYEDTKQKAWDKYQDAKDFGREKYEQLKNESIDGYNEIKDKIKDTDFKAEFDKAYGKVKDVVGKPVKVTKGGKTLPAGVVGAGIAAVLYPLHKSKGVAAAGAAAIGAWAIAKQKNNTELKDGIKNAVDGFGRNFSESFGGMKINDDDCFTIKVDEGYHPQPAEENCDCGCECEAPEDAQKKTEE